jgi:DNA-binding transcriptional ArsR family regulator
MAEENPNSPATPAVAEPARLFMSLGNPIRLDALRIIACEGPQSVTDLGARLGVSQTSMSRHLTLLWQTGALTGVAAPDGDTRKQFYTVPPACVRKTADGMELDYGSCVVRVK